MSGIYFNAQELPTARKEYVAFIDVMGTQNHMKRSVAIAANFIFKLHSTVISALREKPYIGVFLYPTMDGVYITSTTRKDMENILIRILRKLADEFLEENDINHQFLVRGGLAYGQVIHGHDIPYSAANELGMYSGYKDMIILGDAMVAAYDGEGKASPFGIYVDESAIRGSNGTFGFYDCFWKWFFSKELKVDSELHHLIAEKIKNYLECAKDENSPIHYNIESVEKHMKLVMDYFALG